MSSLRCLSCGLVNWSTAESCKKCGGALMDPAHYLEFNLVAEKSRESSNFSWLKRLLVFLLIAIVAVLLVVWLRTRARNQAIVAAIQSSNLFAKQTVEACKLTGLYESPSAEAVTLQDAGLIFIEGEEKNIPSPTQDRTPICKQYGTFGTVPPSVAFSSANPGLCITPAVEMVKAKVLNLTLSPNGIAVASDWEKLENEKKAGWIVPVGTRELIEVKFMEWRIPNKALVTFSWKWKPNEVGRYFDSSDVELSRNPHMRQKSYPVLSSRFPFEATAELAETSQGWEVKSIEWHSPYPGSIY